MGCFLGEQDLITKLDTEREQKKIVFTNGCFDLLHIGHVRYLQEARSLGDLLVVGLNSDSSVKRLKGESRPIQCEEDRGEVLAALSCVDYVVIFSEETPQRLIEAIKPHILVKGGDWLVEKIVGADFVMKNGGKVKTLQFVEGRSTSSILEKVIRLG